VLLYEVLSVTLSACLRGFIFFTIFLTVKFLPVKLKFYSWGHSEMWKDCDRRGRGLKLSRQCGVVFEWLLMDAVVKFLKRWPS